MARFVYTVSNVIMQLFRKDRALFDISVDCICFSSLIQVEIRPMMYVALTYDHRLIDGREAVTFLRKIKSVVEDPRVLLLDM